MSYDELKLYKKQKQHEHDEAARLEKENEQIRLEKENEQIRLEKENEQIRLEKEKEQIRLEKENEKKKTNILVDKYWKDNISDKLNIKEIHDTVANLINDKYHDYDGLFFKMLLNCVFSLQT